MGGCVLMPRPVAVAVSDEPTGGTEDTAGRPGDRIVEVDYQDHTYRFDADEVTIDALEDFENQKYIRALRSILGAEQWAEYKTRHPKAADLDRFVSALIRAAGSAGNSSASSVS